MRDAQFREVQSEIRRGCRTYQDVMAETAREARAIIDCDNANAYAEAVMATLDEGEERAAEALEKAHKEAKDA